MYDLITTTIKVDGNFKIVQRHSRGYLPTYELYEKRRFWFGYRMWSWSDELVKVEDHLSRIKNFDEMYNPTNGS